MEQGQDQTQHVSQHMGLLDEKTFSKYFLLVLFIISLVLFIYVVRIFIRDIILAAVFVSLFYPLFRAFLKLFKGRRNPASLASCLIILLCVVVPLVFISNLVILQGIELYHNATPWVNEIMERGGADLLSRFHGTVAGKFLQFLNINIEAAISQGGRLLGGNIAGIINKTSRVTVGVVVNFFIILFAMFYFFRDGGRILMRVKEVIPLSNEYKDMLVMRFNVISTAMLRGTLLIAVLQSFLATMTLMLFGIKTWLLWGVVMLVFSLIPFVGTGAVLIPTGIIKIATGSLWQGVAIILISVLFISLIDNILRPRLVGKHAGMHDLLVFFSTLGGISVFGPTGLIIGPLIATIFLAVLEIFTIEFQRHIAYPNQ